MLLQNILINNLRNHEKTNLDFTAGLNVIYGRNGAGKTSIIEAISIGGFSKSFLPVSDQNLVKYDADFYKILVQAKTDLGTGYSVTVEYKPGNRKQIKNNYGDNLLPKELIGEMPLVLLSPDFKPITFGPPAERRSFIDKLLAQSSKRYLEELLSYRKCLKQRNALLNQSLRDRYFDYSVLHQWTEKLISTGAEIVFRRHEFTGKFDSIFRDYYSIVSSDYEETGLVYQPDSVDSGKIQGRDSVKDMITESFLSVKEKEYERGTTQFGPQKDEFIIKINGGVARDNASQGQHKSLLISLKFAELDYLAESRKETPIVLLDDIFSELDDERKNKVLELITHKKVQTVITLTNTSVLEGYNAKKNGTNFIKIENGAVKS